MIPAEPARSQPDSGDADGHVGILLLGAWFGLLTGLSQVALRGVLTLWLNRKVFTSPHIVWMTPLADVALFLAVGAVLWLLLLRASPVNRLRASAGIFTFLVFFSAYLLYPRIHWVAAAVLGAGVGVQAGRVMLAHPRGFALVVRRSLVVMTGIVGLLALGVFGGGRWLETRKLSTLPAAPENAPNVLLLILDTVRAASLSLYGYERPTTPGLDSLAQKSVVFDQAFAAAPWTLPSHGSMFTGRAAHELSANWRTPLDDRFPTVAEALRDRGYYTAGFVGNQEYGTIQFGLSRGFMHYDDYLISPGSVATSSLLTRALLTHLRSALHEQRKLDRKTAEDVNNEFLRWLPRAEGRPFFAFLNYMDAHNPYRPPAPYDLKFGPRKTQTDLSLRNNTWTAAQLRMETDAYDDAIAYLDAEIGKLLGELEKRGQLEHTIVIVTSDHGEHIGDHGLLYHGNSLYRMVLHVPLLVYLPAQQKAVRVEESVTLADLAATLLDLTGTKRNDFPGNSLAYHWDPAKSAPAQPTPLIASVRKAINMAPWLPVSKGDMSSLVSGTWHYIQGGDGAVELYNTTADPGELRNVAGDSAARVALDQLRLSLQETMQAASSKASGGR